MRQVPQEASSSICLGQQRIQAVYKRPAEQRHAHADPEAPEGPHRPPAGS